MITATRPVAAKLDEERLVESFQEINERGDLLYPF